MSCGQALERGVGRRGLAESRCQRKSTGLLTPGLSAPSSGSPFPSPSPVPRGGLEPPSPRTAGPAPDTAGGNRLPQSSLQPGGSASLVPSVRAQETELMASQLAPCRWLPTWDVVFFEDGKVLLTDPLDVLQGDVVDLTTDALHGVLGGGGHVGAALPSQVLQAVLEETPPIRAPGRRWGRAGGVQQSSFSNTAT